MQNKFFKCYYCKTKNSNRVPIEQKGEKCKCCLAYNYFDIEENNSKRNNNKKKKGKKKFLIDKNNNNHNHNFINNNSIRNQESSIERNFINTDYYSTETLNNNRLFLNGENTSQISYINGLFERMNINDSYSNNIYTSPLHYSIRNNPIFNRARNNGFDLVDYFEENSEDEKIENFNIIKYSWLKKEKFTEKLRNEKKDDYECTICLENLKLNEDINILKCGHIFHYKCIENLLAHKSNRCPNCRCDLKTGENQPKFSIQDLFYFSDNDDEFIDIYF